MAGHSGSDSSPTSGADGSSGAEDGGPLPTSHEVREPSAWLGVWSGTASYSITVITDPLTGVVRREDKQIALKLQVDEFERDDAAEGWALVVGRVSASECIVSAAIHAMVFMGDAISRPAFPIVSASGGGVDHSGHMVGVVLSGERRPEALLGTLSFESESQRQPPCDGRELAFTLSRGQ
jgi:hypothetical protein